MAERPARPAEPAHAAPTPSARWATPANALTLLRLLAAAPCAWAVTTGRPVLAAAAFALAVASDLADGRLARRRGEASALGGLLDHASDATFVSVGLGALAVRGEVPAALPALVALAFLQYALDSRALAGRPLRASRLGRWNGIAYFALLGVPLVRDAALPGWPPPGAVAAAGWLLVVATLVSMADRVLARRRSSA